MTIVDPRKYQGITEIPAGALPWYRYILPRLFGTRIVGEDGRYRLTGYIWRGCYYFTAFVLIHEPS